MDHTTQPHRINWRVLGWGGAVALLALPFVAMQFTTEVNWSGSDFVIMGLLFAAVGLGLEFIFRRLGSATYRLAGTIAVLTGFLTIWVNLAVGMIGDDNPYNLLFLGVVLVAIAGSVLSRFRPAGMAGAMLAAAVCQGLTAGFGWTADPRGAAFALLFALPWLLAAVLFRAAARS
jgi:hypothetical protein